MKPIYMITLMWALFITGLANGISFALAAIPGVGIMLAFVVTFCINATMGAGLLFLLVINDMFHPKIGPVASIAGMIPPFNFLPLWLGLVAAGIVHDMGKEKGSIAAVAKLADDLQSTKNPLSQAKSVAGSKNIDRLSGRPPQASNDNDTAPEFEREEKSRNLPNLKSPSIAPRMGSDIAPIRNRSYAKAA